MKLQIALDGVGVAQGIELCEKIRDFVDIIEIGTPFLLRDGLNAVRAFRARFPEKEILADAKIMDAGEWETRMCLEAGANYVTVLAVTDILTVKGCAETAKKLGGRAVADMICVMDPETRIAELEAAGITDIAVHTGVDQQAAGRGPLQDLQRIKDCVKRSLVSVAGGVNPENVERYMALGADVIIVGGGIVRAADPVAAARDFAEKLHGGGGCHAL